MLMRGDAPPPQVAILHDLERRIELLAGHVRRLHAQGQANRAPDREHAAAVARQLWDMYQLASRLPLCAAAPGVPAATPAADAA